MQPEFTQTMALELYENKKNKVKSKLFKTFPYL